MADNPLGYRDDGGKIRLDLVPWDAVMRMARVMTWACTDRKPDPYPERNWEAGMNWSRVFGSAMRHGLKMWLSKLGVYSELDEDSGLPHVDHFLTNAAMLCAYFHRPWLAHLDDRPTLARPAGVIDPLKDCPSCAGTKGYHRTPCSVFEVSHRGNGQKTGVPPKHGFSEALAAMRKDGQGLSLGQENTIRQALGLEAA